MNAGSHSQGQVGTQVRQHLAQRAAGLPRLFPIQLRHLKVTELYCVISDSIYLPEVITLNECKMDGSIMMY